MEVPFGVFKIRLLAVPEITLIYYCPISTADLISPACVVSPIGSTVASVALLSLEDEDSVGAGAATVGAKL